MEFQPCSPARRLTLKDSGTLKQTRVAAYQLENSYQRKQPSKEKKRLQQRSVKKKKKNGYTIGGTFPNIDRRSALIGYYKDT